jgi:uncharacterized protein YjiS (DUF1127 family)
MPIFADVGVLAVLRKTLWQIPQTPRQFQRRFRGFCDPNARPVERKKQKMTSVNLADVPGRPGKSQHPKFGRIADFLCRLGERYRTATALRQLETMSDWQLEDVGIDRCGIRCGLSIRRTGSGHARD